MKEPAFFDANLTFFSYREKRVEISREISGNFSMQSFIRRGIFRRLSISSRESAPILRKYGAVCGGRRENLLRSFRFLFSPRRLHESDLTAKSFLRFSAQDPGYRRGADRLCAYAASAPCGGRGASRKARIAYGRFADVKNKPSLLRQTYLPRTKTPPLIKPIIYAGAAPKSRGSSGRICETSRLEPAPVFIIYGKRLCKRKTPPVFRPPGIEKSPPLQAGILV